jgi:hypothetical protein
MTTTVAVLLNEEFLPSDEHSVPLSVSDSELIWNAVRQPNIFLPSCQFRALSSISCRYGIK